MVLYCSENSDRRTCTHSMCTLSFYVQYFLSTIDQIHGHVEGCLSTFAPLLSMPTRVLVELYMMKKEYPVHPVKFWLEKGRMVSCTIWQLDITSSTEVLSSKCYGFQDGITATAESWEVRLLLRHLGILKKEQTRRDITGSGSISKQYLLSVNPVQLTLMKGQNTVFRTLVWS